MKRNEVSENRKWKLSDIIADEKQIPDMMKRCSELCGEIKTFKGKLDEKTALQCFKKSDELSLMLETLYVYASMKSDEDKGNTYYLELCGKIDLLSDELSPELAFVTPELSLFPLEKLEGMLASHEYADYSMQIKGVIRNKEHILSEKEEELLSGIGFAGNFRELFQILDNAELSFGEIEVEGEKKKLTHGTYSVFLRSSDRSVREAAFKQYYASYKALINTIAANYGGSVKKDVYFSKVRKYASCLDKALFSENIDKEVYDNLISSIDGNVGYMHEYMSLRKKALGIDENHFYDVYTPIVENVDRSYDYDEAYAIVAKALSPMGKEYLKTFESAKSSGWIDVMETEGKRSGAYSWGVYGTHPYVLLNHSGTLHDVFTIAHEMGHAMHSFYSDGAQCYDKAQYTIFLAEIASTVNEVMLLKHMLKDADGETEKYLLSYYIDMFRTTVFRQTMFAEFEKFAHEEVEKGEPLSSENMSEYYLSLCKKHFGEDMVYDEEIRYEWARIPHFYSSFYVYKYATGLICAVNIVNNLLKYGDAFNAKYKKFLSAGGSDYPLNILKYVDIDLTTEKPFAVAMDEFKACLDRLKELINA